MRVKRRLFLCLHYELWVLWVPLQSSSTEKKRLTGNFESPVDLVSAAVGGSLRKPTQRHGEHANSAQKLLAASSFTPVTLDKTQPASLQWVHQTETLNVQKCFLCNYFTIKASQWPSADAVSWCRHAASCSLLGSVDLLFVLESRAVKSSN